MRRETTRRARVVFVAMVLGTASEAGAWEAYRSESGAFLHWDSSRVEIVLTPAPDEIEHSRAKAALDAGIVSWGASCGGPEVVVNDGVGGLDDTDQTNTVVWITTEDDWTSRFPSTELARTLLTYRVQSGRMVDVDIAINTAFFDFAAEVGCDAERYDLQGLLTHELGHFFGLDHSQMQDATMWRDVPPGNCEYRTLTEDDRAGYCAIYPSEPGPEVVEAVESEVVEVVESEVVEVIEPGPEVAEKRPRTDGCGGGGVSLVGFTWWCVYRARRRSGR